MFIAILTYKKPLVDVDHFLQAHRDFLAKQYAAGNLITSGPRVPREGGVIMLRAENREKAEAVLSLDPFNINDIADYQLVEFVPTLFCDDILKNLLG